MGKALQRYVPSPCMEMHRHLLHSDVSGGGIVQAEYQVEMHPCKGSHFINTDKWNPKNILLLVVRMPLDPKTTTRIETSPCLLVYAIHSTRVLIFHENSKDYHTSRRWVVIQGHPPGIIQVREPYQRLPVVTVPMSYSSSSHACEN